MTIRRFFYISKYEVTLRLWKAVTGVNPGMNQDDENLPAHQVSWDDCWSFINRLNEKTGLSRKATRFEFRFPSEAEWEYSCRAESASPFQAGSTSKDLSLLGFFKENCRFLQPVGLKKPNSFGIYDMHGNAREWCGDAWHSTYHSAPSSGKTWMEGGDEKLRVFRGGSFFDTWDECRSAARSGEKREWKDNGVGLRLVLASE